MDVVSDVKRGSLPRFVEDYVRLPVVNLLEFLKFDKCGFENTMIDIFMESALG